MFFTRVASRKSTVGKSKVNRDHRRKLFFESLEDRRVLATIAYLSGHQLNASQLAAVGLTVTPNVNGYFPDNAGVASALASGAQAVVFGESVGTGSGLSAATKANIANYASGGGNVIVMGSHGGQSTFLNSVFGFSTGDGGFQLLLTSQDVRFYSHTICPLLPFQNKVSFFLTGPKPPLAALVLGRRFHPPERQRVAVCPRFAPSGGNGKGGEPKSLLPQAESGPVSCRPRV